VPLVKNDRQALSLLRENVRQAFDLAQAMPYSKQRQG
jgi:hypothetical protein